MKKNIIAILLVVIMLLGTFTLSGCKNNNNDDALTIYTSFYPIYDLTLKIVGNKANIVNLVGSGEEAHHYELTPKQAVALENEADLIIINGLDMEHFIEDLSQPILDKVFVASDGLETIEMDTGLGTTKTDPHIWLSIRNSKKMMENIKNHMIILDADNAEYYENNYEKYAILFDALDNAYINAIANFTTNSIIVSHKAFGYLTNDYGLNQISISGLETDGEANPQTVIDIKNYIIDNNITVVYYQEEMNSTIASAIAEQTSATIERLQTVESLSKTQLDSGDDYLSVMAENLLALIKHLS